MQESGHDGGINRGELLRRGAAAGLGLGALGLLGCGSKGSATGSTGAAGKPPSKPTGLARFGFGISGSRLPADAGGDLLVNVDYARTFNVTEPLVRQTSPTPQFQMAESIEPVGKDAKVWDVTIREAEFSTGKPARAEDLIATTRHYSAKTSFLAMTYAAIDSMKKMGPRTVRFTLNTPVANFVTKFGWNLYVAPEGFDPMKPVGTGPYTLESWQRGRKTVLTANPNFWGKGPYIETIQLFEFGDDTARVNALLAGQVDAIETVPPGQVAAIKGSGHQFVQGPSDNWPGIAMHTQKAPFNDVRVRQAMRLIADRKAIVEQALAGYGSLGNDVFSKVDPEYPKDLAQREQDLEQAKSLLKAAGQEGLRAELATSVATFSGPDVAQVYAEQAKQAGVTLQVKQIDPGAFYTPESGYLQHPLSVTGGAGAAYLATAQLITAPEAPFPETHWNDAEWFKLYKQALGTVDDAKRGEIVADLMRIDYERGGYVIGAYGVNTTAAAKKIKGLESKTSTFGFNGVQFETLWVG